MNSLNMPDYYQLLGLSPDANLDEIKNSYKLVCEKFSLFYYSSREEILNLNKDLVVYKDAFDTLSDSDKKSQYDEYLKELINQKAIDLENTHKNIISETSDLNVTFIKDSTIKFEINKVKEEILKENFSKGKEFLNNGQYHEAINVFRKLISLKSKEPKFHSYLGLALVKKGWLEYAEEEFKTALALEPDNVIANKYFEDKLTHEHNKKTAILVMSENFEINTKKSILKSVKTFFNKFKKL